MNRYIKVLILAVLFSFAWGTWWGFYSFERKFPNLKKRESVRVLARKGYFTPAFITEFNDGTGLQLDVVEKDSDIELLREFVAGSGSHELVVFPSYLTKSFLVDNVFQKMDLDRIPFSANLSVDFRHLDYDPDDNYFIPLTWNIEGIVLKSDLKMDETWAAILDFAGKQGGLSLSNEPVFLYQLASQVKPSIRTWAQTGNLLELQKDVKSLKNQKLNIDEDPFAQLKKGDRKMARLSNGRAAQLLQSGFRFFLPTEQAPLWTVLIGITHGTKGIQLHHKVINLLLSDRWALQLVKTNHQATTLASLNSSSELLEMQKPQFLRQVPVTRLQLFIDSEALEPAWLDAVKLFVVKE